MTRGGTHNLADVAVTARTLQTVLVIVPLVGAVVTEDDLATSRKVEMTAVAGNTTGEVHALLLLLLMLLPPLVLLMSS